MKIFLLQNKVFLTLYFLFLIIGGFILFRFEKGDEILYFNSLHTPFFDEVFKRISQLAEFPAMVLILIVTIFSGYGKGLLLSLNSLFIFLFVLLFKKVVFANQIRPALMFESTVHLNFVEGVNIYHYNSFPSGHTATAFGLFFMLSIFSKDKWWSIFLFSLALLVGISRVYLLQHFFRDIYFGSFVAVAVTSVFYITFANSGFYNNLSWKDKSLLE